MMYVDAVDYIRKSAELLVCCCNNNKKKEKKKNKIILRLSKDNSVMN